MVVLPELQLRKEFTFEASHRLPRHKGKCRRLHGHSWTLYVWVSGEIDPDTGFVKDYGDISAVVKPLLERLDHRHLGSWEEITLNSISDDWYVAGLPFDFYPSSENLLIWIGQQLAPNLQWSHLQIEETCTSLASLPRAAFDAMERAKTAGVGK